ncbi:SPFH domain-containing protein [Limnochorda pilosa]|uniref:Uncharacterized protein n=1 Tax=Limnochorda pilosa TaxID=1555112 RepID=A0A0K2SN66_LIMPI|nr:hypothetical protein [Limnochorda pilosa]BAS28555.1 hypothetical protein LIP_2725 [Limnochorda pilosa]
MTRKRADSTVYLGERLVKELAAYRDRYPLPPSASSVVREAVSQYLAEEDPGPSYSPAQWVRATQALLDQLKERGVDIDPSTILAAVDQAEEDRIREILGEPE